MNKALHVLVYLFLALSGTALWFEIQLNAKRAELRDRNRMQENYLIDIASAIEIEDPPKDVVAEIKKDVSPVLAELVDTPEQDDLLKDYNAYLEKQNLETYDWKNKRNELRQVYILDAEGKPMLDGTDPIQDGSPEDKLLKKLFNSSTQMRARLNSTRAELVKLREILEAQVAELNRMKPEARQDKVTIEEKKAKIASLENDVADRDNQIVKIKAEIDELNAEITSLKDERQELNDRLDEKNDDLDKAKKLIEQLKKLLQEQIQLNQANSNTGNATRGTAVTSIPTGDKGTVIRADNKDMFAIVKFSDEAMKELKGENLDHPLPALELGVKSFDDKGKEEVVGRIRLRQEVKDRNYVICDILGAWRQKDLKENDVIFAD